VFREGTTTAHEDYGDVWGSGSISHELVTSTLDRDEC